MKLIIDIPEEKYNIMLNDKKKGWANDVEEIITSGTPFDSDKGWKFYFNHGYAQAKREFESVIEDIKAEIKELFKTPAKYMPNYDAYIQCLKIIDKHISGKENE